MRAQEKESEIASSQVLGDKLLNVLVASAAATEQVRHG